MSQIKTQYLAKLPRFSSLVSQILCKKSMDYQLDMALPDTSICVKNVKADAGQVTSFNLTVDWQQSIILHPGYLHTLAFPLQIKLMLQQPFPFSIIGLVHICNKIEQNKPVKIDDNLTVCCKFGEMIKRDLGVLFTITTTFYVDNECVLSAQHQYLKRETQRKSSRIGLPVNSWPNTQENELWSLNSALGRQYAACSGDYNPIHLHPLSAKLFGFKRHIIHGMWLKSRVISALSNQQEAIFTSSFSCEVDFIKPLYLPNVVRFQQRMTELRSPQQIEFKVTSDKNNPPVEHMTGRLLF